MSFFHFASPDVPRHYRIDHGPHKHRRQGMCALEWIAYLAGEEHSDTPITVDPRLRSYLIGVNDTLTDHNRQKLRPYLARCIGTRDDGVDRSRILAHRPSGNRGSLCFTVQTLELLLPTEAIMIPEPQVEHYYALLIA